MSGTSVYAFDDASEPAGGRFDALRTRDDAVTFARIVDLGGRLPDDQALVVNSYPLISSWGTFP
ncbi:hypothetical protein RB628_16490 [Streptomyces sp. ADMS]|uniref:hypothetical protein n=1 Tax=Streptomyces sp. ADMS TaxID=3071415 RepID=UPI00296F8961|nr:hypothetical protein [Streptomyces sp. ADMS]MDW4906899.1 hypothetical protein [Streptomyces sp. ADMS]